MQLNSSNVYLELGSLSQGETISPVDIKFDIEDRAKCRMCMTFGFIIDDKNRTVYIIYSSILYRIGGERSMKCQTLWADRTDGQFHFSPSV